MTFVKICGITNIDDALLAIAGDLVELVAVVANRGTDELQGLRTATGIRWLQLHGAETPAELDALQPEAFKAVAIGGIEDVARAGTYGGERLLLDAKGAKGELGGTGTRFDWALARPVVESRRVIL